MAKAADVTAKQTTEHVVVTGSVTTGTQRATTYGEGDFQNAPTLGRMTTVATVAGRTVTVQEVLAGTRIYLTSDTFRAELPAGKTWMSIDLQKALKTLGMDFGSLASQSPTDALANLRKSGSVTTVGPQTLDGVATTHYTAVVDPGRVDKLQKALGMTVTYAPVDVWIDAAGLVRRLHTSYTQSGSSVLPASTLEMTMSFSNYGEALQVAVPPDSATFDATDAAAGAFKK